MLLDKFSYNCYYEKIDKNNPIKLEDLPFKIPENWTWVRLKNMVCIETGKKDANFGSVDGNYNFYTCALEPIKSKSYTYDGEYLILPGNGANIGKSIHFIGKFEAYQRTYLLSKTLSTLNFKYLKYVLDIFWESWNKSRMFGSAIPYIKLINLEKFTIPLPSLAEQERIVKKIQSLDLLIQQYNEYETKLTKLESEFEEKLKKSILQYAIQGKLVKQDQNDEPASELVRKIYEEKQKLILEGKIKRDKYESHIYQGTDKNYYEKIDENEPIKLEDLPFKIPKNWTWVRLKTCNQIVVGATPSTSNFNYWNNGTIPWLPSGCCQDSNIFNSYPKMKYITKEGYDSCSTKLMDIDTVLIALTGATAGKVGILKFKACANQSVVGIKPYFGINTNFLFFQLMIRRQEILSDCIGSAQPHISKNYVENIYFALPSLVEQERIVKKIQSIDLLIHQNDKKY